MNETDLQLDELRNVETRLQRQLRGRVAELALEQRDDCLVLRGYTYTYYAKQMAQQVLMENCRHPRIANEIEVLIQSR